MANESQLLLLNRSSVRELQKKMVEIDVSDADDTRVPTAPADISEFHVLFTYFSCFSLMWSSYPQK